MPDTCLFSLTQSLEPKLLCQNILWLPPQFCLQKSTFAAAFLTVPINCGILILIAMLQLLLVWPPCAQVNKLSSQPVLPLALSLDICTLLFTWSGIQKVRIMPMYNVPSTEWLVSACCISENVNGWGHEWMDGWEHGWMDGWEHGWMDGKCMSKSMNKWINEYMFGWMSEWINELMIGWLVARVVCVYHVSPFYC